MSVTSLTKNDIAQRARERMTDQPEAKVGLTIPRLEANVDGALERLARDVALSDERRLLMKDWPATAAVAGVLDLTQAAFNGMLIDTLPRYGQVRLSSGTTPILWMPPRRNAALTTTQSDVIHCWLEGRNLCFKNTDGSLTTFVSAVVVNSSFIPSMAGSGKFALASLPKELEEKLVDLVVEIVSNEAPEKLSPNREMIDREIARAS